MHLRNLICIVILILIAHVCHSQITVAYHQSNVSFIEAGYEINNRFMPSARLGTNLEFNDFILEIAGLYQFKDADQYEIYAGAGIRTGYGLTFNDNVFIVLPVGINFFPFNEKGFGFHIEAAPMLGDPDIFRGSFGIRYRFEQD